MKLLWLCNIVPAAVQEKIDGTAGNGLWLDHVFQDLRQQDFTIRILARGTLAEGQLDDKCSFATFAQPVPYEYLPELENFFCAELEGFQPDVIHIWGTEYAHSLAMVNAAERMGLLSRVVVNIQGLCSVIAGHYNDGVPTFVRSCGSFRDMIRKDNLEQQREKFELRGKLEIQALQKVPHVIGRTHWDKHWTREIHPGRIYHHCDETLRQDFYGEQWQYDKCVKYRIFAAGCSYPVKGFHYMLKAFARILKAYPQATLAVPGTALPEISDWKGRLRSTGYQYYLAFLERFLGLKGKVHYLGSMDACQMKQAYLDANVFVLSSTIENSPNTLGEAMLLGVPCVASDVGGVTTLLKDGQEGLICPSGNVDAMAANIRKIFDMEEKARELGIAAREHARYTHDPNKNCRSLLEIYRAIAQ